MDNEDIGSKINNILGDKSNLKDVMSFITLYEDIRYIINIHLR